MPERKSVPQRKYPLSLPEEALVDQEVEDALRSTDEERKEAAGRAEKDVPDLRRLRKLRDQGGHR